MKRILSALALLIALAVPSFAQQDILKASTGYPLTFLMIDSSDHITGKTGLSPTVTISKAGAAFASPAGAVSEISGGWYKVAGNATDTNTDGEINLHATSAGADPTDAKVGVVVEYDPRNAPTIANLADAIRDEVVNTGTTANTIGSRLKALPDATAGAAGGVFIAGTNAATAITTGLTTSFLGTLTTVTNLTNAPTAGDLTTTMKASVKTAASPTVKPNSAFEWVMQFKTSAGALVTTGTPTCTRSIDAPDSFGGSITATAVSSQALSELAVAAGDTNGTYYFILKCTLTGASTIYERFKIQP